MLPFLLDEIMNVSVLVSLRFLFLLAFRRHLLIKVLCADMESLWTRGLKRKCEECYLLGNTRAVKQKLNLVKEVISHTMAWRNPTSVELHAGEDIVSCTIAWCDPNARCITTRSIVVFRSVDKNHGAANIVAMYVVQLLARRIVDRDFRSKACCHLILVDTLNVT